MGYLRKGGKGKIEPQCNTNECCSPPQSCSFSASALVLTTLLPPSGAMQVVSGLEQVSVVRLRAEGVTRPRVEAGDGQARSENWSQYHHGRNILEPALDVVELLVVVVVAIVIVVVVVVVEGVEDMVVIGSEDVVVVVAIVVVVVVLVVNVVVVVVEVVVVVVVVVDTCLGSLVVVSSYAVVVVISKLAYTVS